MSTNYKSVNRINSLKQSIEAVTGETYSNLTAAIQGLKDNGGNINIEDFVKNDADLGDVDLSGADLSNGLRAGAFAGCYVGNVTLPEGINEIPMWCFYDTDFRSDSTVILPNSLRTIAKEVFLESKVKNITIPEGVTNIGEKAFFSCSLLQDIIIPASVTEVGGQAFNFCSRLSTVTFNGTPSALPTSLFVSCSNLTTINVPWAEGAVTGAPWSASNATINYNYVEG